MTIGACLIGLTLTLGLRYDYFGPFTEAHGRFVGFDPTRLQTTTHSGISGRRQHRDHGRICTGVERKQPVAGNSGNSVIAGSSGYDRISRRASGLRGNRCLLEAVWLLRGGYGVYYDRANSRLLNNQFLDFPYYTLAQRFHDSDRQSVRARSRSRALSACFQQPCDLSIWRPSGDFYPERLASRPAGAAVVRQWHLSGHSRFPDALRAAVQPGNSETNLRKNWMLDIGYVGSEGRRIPA